MQRERGDKSLIVLFSINKRIKNQLDMKKYDRGQETNYIQMDDRCAFTSSGLEKKKSFRNFVGRRTLLVKEGSRFGMQNIANDRLARQIDVGKTRLQRQTLWTGRGTRC